MSAPVSPASPAPAQPAGDPSVSPAPPAEKPAVLAEEVGMTLRTLTFDDFCMLFVRFWEDKPDELGEVC